jgi:hypothetical protein
VANGVEQVMRPFGPAIRIVATFAGLAVLLSPFLFMIYRLAVFNTVPRDDYAGFLLWIAGSGEGGLPGSPYCYRILSMIAALPLYLFAPVVKLTNIPAALTPGYLRATFALSLLAFAASIGAAMITFRLGVREGGLSRAEAFLAGGLLFVLIGYTQITAIDPLAILLIAAAIGLVRRPAWFTALMLASVLANEKVALVLACWLSVRCLSHPTRRAVFWRQWTAALAALALYATIVALARLPGNTYQVDPASYPLTAAENVEAWFSLRGLLLNVLPIAVLSAIGIAGDYSAANGAGALFRRTDLLVIPALLIVALLVTHLFQAGRIVAHAAPLFVIPAVLASRRVPPA